ncbi:hypothetical protein HWI79_3412 [Cryptosporidium felis]|nr:hypothetical protein HWI79_3412 [Cryptosporidium felis]
MSEKSWDRLLLDIATNVRSLHDGDTLPPISQHLALHPFEKIYKDPISMPDLLTTSISDQMKEENKKSELASLEQSEFPDHEGCSSFKDMDRKQICNRINEFNSVIINISQTISDMDFTQGSGNS